jgi:hypothetical protein
MITMAILKDEVVDGQRRAKGKKIRKIVAICIDNYNIMIAEGIDPSKLVGKKFYGKMVHLGDGIAEYGGLDEEYARTQMIDFFERFSGNPVDQTLDWEGMSAEFKVFKRRPDASAILLAYDQLKEKGWKDAA